MCKGSGRLPKPEGEPSSFGGAPSPSSQTTLGPKAMREGLSITQAELADVLKIAPRTVQRLERQDASPAGSTLVIWECLIELALQPRPLTLDGETRPLRRHLSRALTVARRRALWRELLA